MKQEERTSIMRIVSDLIKADAIIDTREINFLMSIKEKYGIKRDDERYVSNITLSQAIRILPQFGMKYPLKNLVISIIFRIFVGDNQIVTNNIKRLPNDFKGQSYRNFLYY